MSPRTATAVGITAIAATIAAGAWLARETVTEKEPTVTATFVVICEACFKISETPVTAHDFGGAFPLACPKCGVREAYAAYICKTCGQVYAFHSRAANDPRPGWPLGCPACRSLDVRPFELGTDVPPTPPNEAQPDAP